MTTEKELEERWKALFIQIMGKDKGLFEILNYGLRKERENAEEEFQLIFQTIQRRMEDGRNRYTDILPYIRNKIKISNTKIPQGETLSLKGSKGELISADNTSGQDCFVVKINSASEVVCECQEEGILRQGMETWYDSERELPYVNHKPNECKCTNDLKRYNKNGKIVWLCSNCVCGEEEFTPKKDVSEKQEEKA